MVPPRDVLRTISTWGPVYPCDLFLAKIDAAATGVPLPAQGGNGAIGALVEKAFSWASPRSRELQIPAHVTFERVYLGGIPETSIPLLISSIGALIAAAVLARLLSRHLRRATSAK